MSDLGKTMFNMQRFMILELKVNPNTSDKIPDDYAFAWYKKMYPFFETNELHEDLKEYFSITEEQVDYVSKYLDDEWLENRRYTFYELEEYFNCRHEPENEITRYVLITILRYIKLREGFDDLFWEKLLTPMKYPTEAGIIISEFSADDILFI
ncbi:MAG TPA: hypothetical protein VJ861_03055 [Treponemataceae bacterium]|nr:hypothetical protein [Treponemataceae bacterium]